MLSPEKEARIKFLEQKKADSQQLGVAAIAEDARPTMAVPEQVPAPQNLIPQASEMARMLSPEKEARIKFLEQKKAASEATAPIGLLSAIGKTRTGPLPSNEEIISGAEKVLIGVGSGMVRGGQGVKQATLALGNTFGAVTDKELADYTALSLEERRFFDQTEVGKSVLGRAGQVIGQYGPELLLGGGISLAGKTALKQVMISSGVGGATGAVQFTDGGSADRLLNIASGAGAGAAAQAVVSVAGRGLRGLKDNLKFEAKKDPIKLLNDGLESDPLTGISVPKSNLVDSKITGEEYIRQVDSTTKGRISRDNLAAAQSAQIERVVAQEAKGGGGALNIGNDIVNSYSQAVGNMKRVRNDRWQKSFGEIAEMTGNQPIFKTTKLKEFADQEIERLGGALEIAGNRAQHRTVKLFKENLPDNMTATQASDMLVSFTGSGSRTNIFGQKGTVSQSKAFADNGKRKVLEILDDTAALGTGVVPKAAQKIRATRQDYAVASDELNQVRKSSLGALIGRKSEGELIPEEIYGRLTKLTGTGLTNAKKILDEINPQIFRNVQAQAVADALAGARRGANDIDLKVFNAAINKMDPRMVNDGKMLTATLKATAKIEKLFGDATALKSLEAAPAFKQGFIDKARDYFKSIGSNDARKAAFLVNPEARKLVRAFAANNSPKALGQLVSHLTAEGLLDDGPEKEEATGGQ